MNESRAAKSHTQRLRIATYNVHKCRGMDGRVRPDRILRVLSEIDADVFALQEMVCIEGKDREHHQARYFAEELRLHFEIGENRRYKGGAYGNVLLSRYPIRRARNYDLSVPARERRGCLQTDIHLKGGVWLHIFNLHLGTSFFERRKQVSKLFRDQVFTNMHLSGNKIILGDLNEWTRGLTSRLLHSHFKRAEIHPQQGRRHSYPGVLPMLPLDHIYFDGNLNLDHVGIHRTRKALVASDHLPLVADFRISIAAHHASSTEFALSGAALPHPQRAGL